MGQAGAEVLKPLLKEAAKIIRRRDSEEDKDWSGEVAAKEVLALFARQLLPDVAEQIDHLAPEV